MEYSIEEFKRRYPALARELSSGTGFRLQDLIDEKSTQIKLQVFEDRLPVNGGFKTEYERRGEPAYSLEMSQGEAGSLSLKSKCPKRSDNE